MGRSYGEGKYHQIHEAIWDKQMRLLGPLGLALYFYLRTCRHRNSEGLFYLPLRWIMADTSFEEIWVWIGLQELEQHGFIKYDHENEVVLDLRALDHWEPKGRPQLKGAVSRLAAIPESPLHSTFVEVARSKASRLADVIDNPNLLEDMKKGSGDGSRGGIDTPSIGRGRDRARARQSEEELGPRIPRCRCGSDENVQKAGDGYICDSCLREEQKWAVPYVADLRPVSPS